KPGYSATRVHPNGRVPRVRAHRWLEPVDASACSTSPKRSPPLYHWGEGPPRLPKALGLRDNAQGNGELPPSGNSPRTASSRSLRAVAGSPARAEGDSASSSLRLHRVDA